jgi:predicted Zn-dependent peptidase
MYKKTILNNGLKVITNYMPDRQSIALGVWVNVGGRYESSRNKGISHFLEHMLFKGSKKYSCRRIKESIEGVGGSLNGFTAEEVTCYLVKMPKQYLKIGLDVLLDMVISPRLSGLEIAKEKTVILEEIKMYRDLPQSYVHELLDELLWPGQPLGFPIIGTEESVGRIQKKDLSDFKKVHYTAPNIVVSATGTLNHAQLVKWVDYSFKSLEAASKNSFLKLPVEQVKPRVNILYKDTEQTHMALGYRALKRDHPLRYALGMLNIILGANMSSRLFNELREKRGLAYEIGTQVKRLDDTGAFVVHAGIDNLKVIEALELILKELKETTLQLVGQDEFRRAKDFYLGQLLMGLEDTLDHMLWIGETTVTLDKTYSLKEITGEIKRSRREDIREVARLLFKEDNLNLALIGPIKESQERINNLLHL